jgi:PAS domain S-box-containing protein
MTPVRDRVSRIPEALILGASLAIVLAIAILSYRSGETARIAEEHRVTAQRIAKLDASLLSMLKDAETGQRGFLLTGRDDYLANYNQAVAEIPEVLKQFREATASHPDLALLLERIEPPASAKLSELKATIELRRANRVAEALAVVDTNRGKAYMDEIRTLSLEIEQMALHRQQQFERDAQAAATDLRRLSVGGSILLTVFLVLSTITVFHGMTRRDELFHQAYAGEKLLGITLASIADGVIATDAQGRITFINPVARKLTGWTENDAMGTSIDRAFAIIHETSRLEVENPLKKALAQGTAVGLANHTNLISKTGPEVPIDDSAAPLRDEHGNIIGAVLVFRDISARRRAEQQLRNANQELQQFIDGAAHDLRSPLNSVSAVAQLLAERYQQALGPQGKELIGYINGSISRMKALLEDLLTFARASHFDEAVAEPIPLDRPFQSAVQNLQADIEQKGATVTSDPLPVAGVLEAHALQLFQNLIGNALKYHGNAPPRIHVHAEQKDAEWLIGITDNGIGIDPQYLEQIFKPFKRLHDDDYPGSGIGLATCQKIVKGYGGRIWAGSVPGKGSTFFIALPAGQPQTAGEIPAAN